MADDPREILKAAGAECAEVGEYMQFLADFPIEVGPNLATPAILALARLVAKYKWMFGEAMEDCYNLQPKMNPQMAADLYDKDWRKNQEDARRRGERDISLLG